MAAISATGAAFGQGGGVLSSGAGLTLTGALVALANASIGVTLRPDRLSTSGARADHGQRRHRPRRRRPQRRGRQPPAAGGRVTLLRNDGTDPVAGTFAQGGSVTFNGRTFAINYAAGDGNDVTLAETTRPFWCS